jgi:tetratricopeptide (TPR) repeat protein
MGKLTVFFVIVFLVIVGLLAFFNKGMVELTVWHDVSYTVPVIAVVLMSAAFGLLSMTIIVAIRDARKYIESWQLQRQQNKEKKVGESYAKGLDAYHASRYEEAADLFTQVTEDEPTHMGALIKLGDIALSKGEFTGAKDFYLMARDIRPRNIEVLMSLHRVSVAQQKWQEALTYLDDILEIDDQNIEILRQKRGIYEKMNKWEDLVELQYRILKCRLSAEQEQKENEALLGYKYELGRHQLDTGDTEKAVKTFKGVIKADHNFAAAYLTLAEAYSASGNTSEAADVLRKGYEAGSSLVFLAKLEEHYIAEGEPGTIIDLYQKALQKDRGDVKLQFLLAKLYYRLEMIDFAVETVNAIDSLSFDYPGLHALLGCIYERRSQYEKAVEEFKKSLHADDPILVPYCCSHCNASSHDWSGRCPECKNWNTFILDVNEVCKIEKRPGRS